MTGDVRWCSHRTSTPLITTVSLITYGNNLHVRIRVTFSIYTSLPTQPASPACMMCVSPLSDPDRLGDKQLAKWFARKVQQLQITSYCYTLFMHKKLNKKLLGKANKVPAVKIFEFWLRCGCPSDAWVQRSFVTNRTCVLQNLIRKFMSTKGRLCIAVKFLIIVITRENTTATTNLHNRMAYRYSRSIRVCICLTSHSGQRTPQYQCWINVVSILFSSSLQSGFNRIVIKQQAYKC